jgi:hypothetical protein
MLYHHDNKRTYEAAASEAATHAREKMLAIIERGVSSASKTVNHVFSTVPTDALVRDGSVLLDVDGREVWASAPGLEPQALTDHALAQLATRAGMPLKFAKECLESDNMTVRQIVPEAIETLLRAQPETSRALVRSVDNKIHAVLSDSYRRMDSRPLLESFMTAADGCGLVPVQGTATDTKVSLRMMLPTIYEPAAHEVICFGLDWSNSDFGAGAHNVSVFMLRLWCTNFGITEKALRQVHLGKRLDEGTFSQKTYALDTETQASALGDIVRNHLSADNVRRYCDTIAYAAEHKIDATAAIERMVKGGTLNKGEGRAIADKFCSADVEMLPAGNTSWRLSNAISWFAHKGDGAELIPTADRRMDLERLAGNVLPLIGAKAA